MQEKLKRDAVCNAVKRMLDPKGVNFNWMRSQLYKWLGKTRAGDLIAQPYIDFYSGTFQRLVVKDDRAFLEVLVGFGTITQDESLMIQAELTVDLLEDP